MVNYVVFIIFFSYKFFIFFKEVRDISRISRKKEMEIRLRYEYGEDLKELAIEYKIPLATLNFRKKKAKQKGDPWIKGVKNKQGYEYFVEDEKERKLLLLKKINSEVEKHLSHVVNVIDSIEAEEKESISISEVPTIFKTREEAIGKRIDNISRIAEIKRDIAGVYLLEKQLLIDKLDLENKLKQQELEDKTLELEIKKSFR